MPFRPGRSSIPAMSIIFVPGAIIAALILFRWARRLAVLTMFAMMVWFYVVTQGWVG